jgi:hypothetical protein
LNCLEWVFKIQISSKLREAKGHTLQVFNTFSSSHSLMVLFYSFFRIS